MHNFTGNNTAYCYSSASASQTSLNSPSCSYYVHYWPLSATEWTRSRRRSAAPSHRHALNSVLREGLHRRTRTTGSPRWIPTVKTRRTVDDLLQQILQHKYTLSVPSTFPPVGIIYYRVVKESKPQTISLPNIDRFSNFFHWCILSKICNKVVTKHTTIP